MKTIRLVTASFLTLSLGTLLEAADKQIADSQHKWIEVYQKQKNIPLPETMLMNHDQEPSLKKGFVSLYNGKNLDGWVPYGGHCTF